jgi:hypothetical protein
MNFLRKKKVNTVKPVLRGHNLGRRKGKYSQTCVKRSQFRTKNIETSIEDENIFTYLELPSRMLLYMNGKPVMAKFHLFIECIFYYS